MNFFSLTVCAFGLCTLLAPAVRGQAADNLIHNGDFEQGPWGGNAWRGQGKVSITSLNPANGATSLHVEGTSADAQVQGISRKIAVEPGATYVLDCQYKAPAGSSAIHVRWSGNKGFVYQIRKNDEQWTSLAEGIAQGDISGMFYPVSLGNPEGRENIWNNRITIPAGVTEVTVYVTVSGVGVINVDDFSLRRVSGENAPKPTAVIGGAQAASGLAVSGGSSASSVPAAAAGRMQTGNLVQNGDFSQGAWGGNAWRGQGKVRLGEAATSEGGAALLVEGLSADAQVQGISRTIAVEPGATYVINCQYRAPVGAAALQLRWQGSKGIVYQIQKNSMQWQSLLQGILQKEISVLLYPVAMGDPDGRTHIWNNQLVIPQDVSEVTLYVTMSGEGFVNVDDVTLVKVSPGTDR